MDLIYIRLKEMAKLKKEKKTLLSQKQRSPLELNPLAYTRRVGQVKNSYYIVYEI